MPTLREKLSGVVFGVEHFKHFTYGHHTYIITDHKSQLPLFDKSLTNTTTHLSKLLLHISDYDLKLYYQPCYKMKLSNALSRQSSYSAKDGNNTEVKGLDVSIPELEADIIDCKLEKIHSTTQIQNYGCWSSISLKVGQILNINVQNLSMITSPSDMNCLL